MIDPTLNADVYSDKPHAESPLLATMNYISVVKTAPNEPLPAWDDAPLHEDATALFDGEDHAEFKGNPAQRKKFFGSVEHRQQTRIGPEHVVRTDPLHCEDVAEASQISADFCNPYISFETLSLKVSRSPSLVKASTDIRSSPSGSRSTSSRTGTASRSRSSVARRTTRKSTSSSCSTLSRTRNRVRTSTHPCTLTR